MSPLRSVALVAAVMVLGGCAAPVESDLPAGVTVVVQQNRSDCAVGRMQIRIDNASDADLTVTSATLTDPCLADAGRWDGSSDIAAGLVRDLPVDLPAADCPATGRANPEVELAFLVDGRSGTARVPPIDPFDLIDTATAATCAAEEVTDAVELTLGRELGLVGDGTSQLALLEITARPTGERSIRLQSVQRTILLQPEAGAAAWSIEQTATRAAPATASLEMVPARCDPHAVAEDKVGTRFPLTVSLDGEAPVVVTLAADDELKRQLFDYIARRCGWS